MTWDTNASLTLPSTVACINVARFETMIDNVLDSRAMRNESNTQTCLSLSSIASHFSEKVDRVCEKTYPHDERNGLPLRTLLRWGAEYGWSAAVALLLAFEADAHMDRQSRKSCYN